MKFYSSVIPIAGLAVKIGSPKCRVILTLTGKWYWAIPIFRIPKECPTVSFDTINLQIPLNDFVLPCQANTIQAMVATWGTVRKISSKTKVLQDTHI
jgi:hypothetical protein